jgi:aspartate racemase
VSERVSPSTSANGDGGGVTRILGIVGGTGPESTIDYYRALVAGWRRRNPDGSYPRVIIDSVELGRVMRWLEKGDVESVGKELGTAVGELAAAGAGVALLASNWVHLAFDQVAATAPIPLIHIVDAARAAALARGYRRLGLFGTRFVMEASMYPDRFAPDIGIVAPAPDERAYIHAKYLDELIPGTILDETRTELVSIIAAMRDRDGIDGLILGGTELALILTADTYAGVPILDTARIHVEAALDWLLEEQGP